MNTKDENKLFEQLCDLYQKTKSSDEPFTFWMIIKCEPNKKYISKRFNSDEHRYYANVGIVAVGSRQTVRLMGFHFSPISFDKVSFSMGNDNPNKYFLNLYIKRAKEKNKSLSEDQILDFLKDIKNNKNFIGWSQDTNIDDTNLIPIIKNKYFEFFKYVKSYDKQNGTCFYDVLKITREEFDKNLDSHNKKYKQPPETEGIEDVDKNQEGNGEKDDANRKEFDEKVENMNYLAGDHPLNLILYGPPGTGKTYNTVNKALKIIDGKVPTTRESAKKRYDELVEQGQIVFTTFHQSMSYEDFIEGIKPDVDSCGKMNYKVKDGIFKEICYGDCLQEVPFSCVYAAFQIKNPINSPLKDGKTSITIKAYSIKNTKGNIPVIRYEWGSQGMDDIVQVNAIQHMLENNEQWDFNSYSNYCIPLTNKPQKNNASLGTATYQKIIFNEFENIRKELNKILNVNTSLTADKKVLIIDEINRGNVAQIFGELITLIEPSKRLGNSEEMKAILPYSSAQKGEPVYFGVPNNLYIIGTMNTADRSVEALDTALRRRFSFEEMMPKPKLLGDKELCDVKLSDLLTTINQRIVALKDREHQIGHSYFMGLKTDSDLKDVFKDKIIPLLQEYFYSDYKKIYYVLGPGFVEKKTEKTIFAIENPDYDEFDIPEERYDIVSFDATFNIKDAIEKMRVQKLDSGTGTMSTETAKIETDATAESEESTDKK